MTVFKAYLKILIKNKWVIIGYTLLLILFGTINMESNEQDSNYINYKPDIILKNNDDGIVSKDLENYLKETTNILDIREGLENDSLFYREASCIITIPEGFSDSIYENILPIDIKTTNNYQSSIASIILNRYLKLINVYKDSNTNQEELVKEIRNSLSEEVKVNITNELDENSLSKASTYFNFANYSIIASLVYVISLLLNVFNNINLKKRMLVSKTDYKIINRRILLSNFLLSFVLFLIYAIISFVAIGDIMYSYQGLLCILNLFVFMICSTIFANLLGNLITNKDALSGIINVVALGTSFLCGAFIPQEWLPKGVLNLAHVFPSYYYINSNDLAINLGTFDFNSIKPILINYLILLIFSFIFIIFTRYIIKKKKTI